MKNLKNLLIGGVALLVVTACNGLNLPLLPAPPTGDELDNAEQMTAEEIKRVCDNLNTNEKTIQAWLDFIQLVGGQFDLNVDGLVKIPPELLAKKEALCNA